MRNLIGLIIILLTFPVLFYLNQRNDKNLHNLEAGNFKEVKPISKGWYVLILIMNAIGLSLQFFKF